MMPSDETALEQQMAEALTSAFGHRPRSCKPQLFRLRLNQGSVECPSWAGTLNQQGFARKVCKLAERSVSIVDQ